MNRRYCLLLLILMIFASCGEDIGEKPANLLSRDQMVNVLTDIHLGDAVYQTRSFSNEKLMKYSESDFYYSILKKYHLADSVFEKSLIYYSGKPKEYEKIYTRVINKLTEMEQEEKKKTQQPIQLEQQEEK
ncbi:MAG TPA: DUF4296 domain-containing protein [Prolixibacteraceae bacterium]|nr:DUF4296 domain-containing protein [Prolixibacteraceae bacterium]